MTNITGIKFLYIEGNIGSGKSTLITKLSNAFKTRDNIIFACEPLDKWQSLLKMFYEEMEETALSLEFLIAASRFTYVLDLIKLYEERSKTEQIIIVSERSLWSQRNCFAPLHKGYMHKTAYEALIKVLDDLISRISVYETKFVFIDINSETCKQRIVKRGRHGEEQITIEYLSFIEQLHNEYFIENDDIFVGNNKSASNYIKKYLTDCL